VDLLAAVFERLYEVSDAVHCRLTKTVNGKTVRRFADVRRQEMVKSSQFVVVWTHVSHQEILSLTVDTNTIH